MSSTDIATIPGKAPKQVSPKVRAAIDLMCWEGKPYAEAANAVGLTARAMRMALERPHALTYLRSQRKALLASLGPKAIHRLDALANQEENRGAGVAACRTILSIADEDARRAGPGHGATQPGFVIVCRGDVEVHQPPPQPVIEGTAAEGETDND